MSPQHTFVLSPPLVHKLLGELVYQCLADLIDFEGLYNMQTMLAMNIAALGGIAHERASELARSMIDEAWTQLEEHPMRRGQGFDMGECECCAMDAAAQAKARARGPDDAKH